MSGNFHTGERSRQLLAEIRKQIDATDWTTPENAKALAEIRDPAYQSRLNAERAAFTKLSYREYRKRKKASSDAATQSVK
jgi:hypothetical protein